MRGQVLDFSAQTNAGVVSGDDGNRYSFARVDWHVSNAPRVGMRVDFEPNGNTATGIYAVGNAGAAVPSTTPPSVAAPAAAPRANSSASTMGVAGMIIGLPALILFWVPAFGWILMVAGLGLSVAGLVMGKQREEQVGFAKAGVVLNSIALTITTFVTTVAAIYTGFLSKSVWGLIEQWTGPISPVIKWFVG